MAFRTAAVAVAADTNVQVAGATAGPVSTSARSLDLKLRFVPTSTAAVVTVAEDAATLTAGEGFPLQSNDPEDTAQFQGDDQIELVAADALWVRATEAGVLYVFYNGA